MAKQYSNVQPQFDTFAGWLSKTNQIAYDMSTVVVTVDTTTNGAITTGNTFVNGNITAQNVYINNTLFGGNPTNPGVLSLGANVFLGNNTLSLGNSSANVTLNSTSFSGTSNIANYATVLATARNIALTSDVTGNVNFDGSSNVSIVTALTNTAVTANTYGNSTFFTVFSVDSKGRLTAANAYPVAGAVAAGVGSFNGRTGAVSLTSNDVVNALSFTPVSANTSGSIAGTLTLTSNGDILTRDVISSRQLLVGNTTVNSSINSYVISVGGSNSTNAYISVGNTTVYTITNATSFSGTSNNSTNFGGLSLSTVQSQITGNAATAFSNAIANASSFVTSGGYTVSGVVTYSANVTVSNNEVQYPKFRGYKEAVTAANTGTAYTLDLSTTNIFDLTLNNNATFTFSNPPSIGTSYSFTIVLHQDSVGSRTVTWPSSAKFTDNTYPILTTTANQVDIVTFFTVDGGTRYYGSFAAANTY